MNILLVTDPYPPQLYSISLMMQQLADDLAKRGDVVYVITPLIASDKINKVGKAEESGVNVIRVKTLPLHNINYIIRGISQILLPHLFYRSFKKHCNIKIDKIIVYSPPLTLGLFANKIKKIYNSKIILNIQDIFPQSAIDLKLIKNKFLIKYFESIESKIYNGADKITSHTITSRQFLIKEKELSVNKVEHIPNWIDLDAYNNRSKVSKLKFREKNNLDGKIIFLFAGVMGLSQGLELIIDIALELQKHKNVHFLLLGDGMEKNNLVRRVDKLDLNNVLIHPFISQDDYVELLKEVDVGVLSLSSKVNTPVVPGKIFGYMAASLPIFAILNNESDGHQMIVDSNSGYTISASKTPKEISVFIEKIINNFNDFSSLGNNGRNYVINNYERKKIINKLIDII
jgi:colanic acid biosynthesis glycosyl transferase WcaI